MDLLGYPQLPQLLKRLNIKDYKKFKTFVWNGSHITAVVRYLQKLRSINNNLFDLLERIEASRDSSQFPQMVLLFVENLKDCFKPPKLLSIDHGSNELMLSFLDFLLDTVEEIVKCSENLLDPIEDQFQHLQKKLKFLISILNDAPFRRCETKNILQQVEAFAEQVGHYLYLYFFTDEIMHSRLDLPLFQLLEKFELVEAKIKEHFIFFAKLPSFDLSDKAVDSLFIADSLLNDLEEILNRDDKDNLIADVSAEIKALQEELTLAMKILGSVKEQQKSPEVAVNIRDAAYEAEYLISSLIVGDVPVWYIKLRLPSIVEKIKLVRVALQEIKKMNYDDNNTYIMSSFIVGDIPICYRTLKCRPHNVKIDTTPPQKMRTNLYSAFNKYTRDEQVCLPTAKKIFSTDETVVGFQKEALKIAEQLVGGPNKLQVILISGMPGLGKTTLAKKLFNDPAVSQHFDYCAWCVASQAYHLKTMLIDILSFVRDLDDDKWTTMEVEALGQELYKTLIGHRYFVVIDDMWSSNVFYEIKPYLPQGPGNRILITSHRKDLAPRDSIVHALPFRSDDQCWDILKQKVYKERDHMFPVELVDVGKQIAAHCQGLPLAVVVIAAVLAKANNTKKLWSEVARTLNSQISKDPNIYKNILELSYKHLPHHLRPCFLYFGAFQEDREISVRKLMSLWIAEGFIPKKENESLRSVAEGYLTDLISRSLVWVSRRRSNHGVKTCSTHDLMRYFCLRKAREENFLNVIDDQFSIYEHHHRLCIPSKLNYIGSRPLSPRIRSWLGRLSNVAFICSRTKLLRILDSSSAVEFSEDQDLDQTGIEQLFHLRYLDIRINADTIPSAIGRLHNLEYLHLFHGSQPLKIPSSLLSLKRLRHLEIRAHAVFDESCHNKVALDRNFQMKSLERISNIHILDENDEKILRCSPKLISLKCATKPLWDSTEMCYRYLALDYLMELRSINITYLGSDFKFKDAIEFPLHLTKVTLHEFKLSWGEISMIGKLPKLEVLKLQYVAFDGKEWKTNDGEFGELKFLKLEALRIHRWTTFSDHFPKLQQLIMLKCWKLKRFPASLVEILTLQLINISFCSKGVVDSASRLQQEQLAMGNEVLKFAISGRC